MFFGREDVLHQLASLWGKRVSSLVTCRGRRRIGKSTVIERFATQTESRFIKIEGKRPRPGMTNESELQEFARQLADQCDTERTVPSDWRDAFRRLDAVVKDGEKTVVLLDEVSWLAYYADDFADDLKIIWDNKLKKHDRLVLVVCGSVSSWIRDNIVDNGAYMGRRSLDIVVRELPLHECVKFWGATAGRVATKEILDVLSVTGGVPRYLEEINPSLSAAENIRNLAFRPNGVLRVDYDEMFADVITKRPRFAAHVLECLVDGPLGTPDIAKRLGVDRSGNITFALKQLEEAGFVSSDVGINPETGEVAKDRNYRLRDNYSRFFLKCIRPAARIIDEGSYAFHSLDQISEWDSIMGLAFENLVVNNYRELLAPLHMDRALVVSAAPFRRAASAKTGRKGVQIDLLVQTKMSICIVEIKRKREIGREIVGEISEKCERLAKRSGVSLRTALVYDGELAPSVEADGYIDSIVSARQLLGI